LAVPGDAAGIRAVFASAYLSLGEPVRRTFRLLSLHAGPSFSAHLAAVITGGSYAEAAAHLAELAGTNLLMPDGERYRFHDLIQLYAAECTTVEEPGSAIASTRSRIFDWYLGIAHAANQVLDPARDKVNITTELAELPFERTHPQVMSFLDGEQPSLGPVVRNAVQTGNHVTAWQLTYLVSGFYDSHGVHDRLEMCANGIRAAQELADPAAEVLMRNIYAATCVLMRRFDEALAQLDAALPLAHETADTSYLATTHTNIAVANSWLKRYDLAQQAYERSLAIHTANGNTHSMALLLNNLGNLRRKAGEGLEALEYLAQALELASSLDSPRLEAIIHQTTGEAHKALGAHQAALDQLRQALALRRRIADRRGEVEALHEMGAIHFDLEDTSSALAAFQEALGLCKLLGNEHLTAVLLRRAGETMLRAGDLPAAASLLQESRNLRARIPDPDEETRLRHNIDELQNLSSVYPP